MKPKIKALGLAVVAMAAMSMAATSAQAFEMHVTHEGSATLIGEQTKQFVLQTSAGNVVCTTANFEGTQQGQGPQITNQHSTLTPTLSGCQAFGLAAQIKPNGCKFTITNKSATGVTTAKTGYVDLTGCTAGKQIEIIAGGGTCTGTIPEQHHLSHVVFQNNGSGGQEDVNINLTLSGIAYELHGAFCPGGGATGLRTNGTTHGEATFRTYKDTGTQQVTEHGHQFNKSKHNNELVGLLAT